MGWVIFALPDPDSGYTDLIESGSNPDPDSKHCSIFDLDEEDDGELRPVRKAPAIIKPPPNNTRLPANMENPRPNNNRPRIGGAPLWSAMAPPSTPNSHKVQGRVGKNPV